MNFQISVYQAVTVEPDSRVEGKSLLDIDLRKKTGVTLLAIRRESEIIEHPVPETIFKSDDIAYLLGNPEQINFASELLLKGEITSLFRIYP